MKTPGRKIIDMSGERVGRWLVLHRVPSASGDRHARFMCRCDCGTERQVVGSNLRKDGSLSCGCLSREKSSERLTTHGMTKHRLFAVWNGMMNRCYSASNPAYKDYGGRGIFVCDRWHDVTKFILDNDHLAAPKLSLDRIDNDGPYSPANTRWTTNLEQSRNRRTNVRLTFEGRTQTAFEWACEIGMKPKTLLQRVNLGWRVEDVLTRQVSPSNKMKSFVTYKNVSDTIGNHARRAGLDPLMVAQRIRRNGWSVDKALETPNRKGAKL